MNRRRTAGLCALMVLVPLLGLVAAGDLPAPRWVAALYVKAQKVVGLRWTAVPGAREYQILRSTTEGRDHEKIASVVSPQYFDKDLTPGTAYYYLLKAVFGDAVSIPSEEKKVVVPGLKKSLRSPPVMKNATSQATVEFGKTTYRAGVEWEPVGGAIAYNLYRSTDPDGNYELITSTSKTQSVDTDVKAGEKYYYRVSVLDGEFQESAPSDEKTVKVDKVKRKKRAKKLRQPHRAAPGNEVEAYTGTRALSEEPDLKPLSVPTSGVRGSEGRGMEKVRPDLSQVRQFAVSRGRHRQQTSPDPSYRAFGESFDEVWVVQRIEKKVVPGAGEEWPGSGELRAVIDEKKVALPLKHTAVDASISGYVAEVKVTQQYHNPYTSKIEAVYVFPLPQNAAVSDFVMTIGERRIRGIIRDREEAQRIYQEAKRQGYTASLLTQERPNIFTQKVANIEPGRAIDIDITYFNTLAYDAGEYTFVFPMVVGPRYNPPGFTDGVGAVGRGAAGGSGQKTEVPYLRPEERSGHDIAVTVALDAGVRLEKVTSPSHAVEVEKDGRTAAHVRLRPHDTIPNRDFVLRYQVAGKKVKSALMTDRDERGGYFTLMLQPPANLEDLPRAGQEMVFVIDTSGSMSGWPIAKAKAVLERALKNLGNEDTFQIVRFAGAASTFAPEPVPASQENVAEALAWLRNLKGRGGTELLRGIQAALDFPHDERRLRIVSFMTDGYIGNERQIFQAVSEKLGPARIFSFGIGNAVNRHLIEGLARIGRGAVAYVLTGDSDVEAVDQFYRRIRHPALTGIDIDWGGMEVTDIYPSAIPDLFVGRPVIVTGRYRGHGETTIRIRGRCAGEAQSLALSVNLDDREARHRGIARIWARARIADLSDSMAAGGEEGLAGRIRETALQYGLLSAYTAFVAVDSSRRTAGEYGTTVPVPVPLPEGVRYETTVVE